MTCSYYVLQENSNKKHFCEEWTWFACKWFAKLFRHLWSGTEPVSHAWRDATWRHVDEAGARYACLDSEPRDVRNRCEWRQRGSESTKLIKMASTVHVKRFYMHGGETASISSTLTTKKQLSEISTSHQLQSICLHEEQSISRVHYCDVIQQMTRQINSARNWSTQLKTSKS